MDATNQGPTAIALNFLTHGLNENCSEDCLTLNIYTKEVSHCSFFVFKLSKLVVLREQKLIGQFDVSFKINPRKPLPVMVWIHGGAFKYGDSTENLYGPDYLLEKNVVFVSINYRLGALGNSVLIDCT